ncbi:MAG: PAS domain S-box protein, partial [Rubricoccaceae bacterium]|nr:PAS domain S-box protein [Rubricoccaceae bacterium]
SLPRLTEALGAVEWDAVVASASDDPPADALRTAASAAPGLPVVVVTASGAGVEAFTDSGAAAVLTDADLRFLGAAVAVALRTAAPSPSPQADPMPLFAAASDAPHLLSPHAGAVQALAEHLPVGLYQSTPDGRILFANEALADVLGTASVEELARLDVRRDLGYPRQHFDEQVQRTGSVRNLVVRWTDRTGRTKYTRENARAVYGADGEVSYYEGTMEDVTAEYEARQRERQRAERLGAIVRFATTVDGSTTAEAVYRAAIAAVTATMGTPLAMLLVRRGSETRCVARSEALPDAAVALFNEHPVGALLPLHTQPILLRDERSSRAASLPEPARAMMQAHGVRSVGSFPLVHNGQAHGAFVVFYRAPHTFTDEELQVAETLAWHVAGSLARQRAESSLRDSETCLRFLAENTTHVLYRLRHGAGPALSRFDYLSPAVEALVGYTPEELGDLGGLGGLIDEEAVIEGDGLLEGGSGEHYLARYRMRTKAGGAVWVENSAYPWCDADGRPVGLVGMLQDVTERKRQEDAQAGEAARVLCQQRALVELGGLHAGGPEAVIGRAVELMAACTGADETGVWVEDPEAAVLRCLDLYHPETDAHGTEPPLPLDASRALLDELQRHRVLAVDETEASATLEWVGAAAYLRERGIRAVLLAPVRRSGRVTGIVALRQREPRAWSAAEQEFAAAVADIVSLAYERQERRAAEAARHESEARYRAISELASDYAFAVHIESEGRGCLAWATEAFARVTRYSAADIRGLRDLLAIVHPDSRADAFETFRALEPGTDAECELHIVTRDGEDRWVRHRARATVHDATGTTVVYHSGQDVTERKQFERELIEAREAAVEMARLKSAFLANMSHEIRTPLTGILGYAGLLAEEVEGEQQEFVQFIEKSGRRLLDTLNSVLELARLEANGVEPSLEVLDVVSEAEEAVRLLTPLAEAKGLALTLDPAPARAATASLDRVCLGRILSNLIGNAVKFTEEGGVHVRVEVDEADVLVHVRDTGRGIAAGFLPHLFDEFKQESEGHARSHEGAGLGLAITKRLTDLLGGAIAVECPTTGGTVFTVAFPRHLPATSGDGAGAGLPSAPPLVQPAHRRPAPSAEAAGDAPASSPSTIPAAAPVPANLCRYRLGGQNQRKIVAPRPIRAGQYVGWLVGKH